LFFKPFKEVGVSLFVARHRMFYGINNSSHLKINFADFWNHKRLQARTDDSSCFQ